MLTTADPAQNHLRKKRSWRSSAESRQSSSEKIQTLLQLPQRGVLGHVKTLSPCNTIRRLISAVLEITLVHTAVARKSQSAFVGILLTASRKSFKQEDLHKFIRHLRNGHFRFFSCVACYHTFSTPSALLAHMESYTRNCSAAKSDLFDFSVTSISGGTLQCSGKNLDGSKRIVGAKPTSAELLESVIEGLDVDSLAV